MNCKRNWSKNFVEGVWILRIKDGKSILDNTSIHPEDYELTAKLQKTINLKR